MRRFFNSESFLWRPLGVLGDLVVLSLLWTVLSLPLVTLGPASAALYDAAVHGLRQREGASLTRFLSTFRRELKEGVLSSLFWLGLALALGLALWAALRFLPVCAEHWPLMLSLALLAAFFLLGILCWVYPLLSRFTMGLSSLHVTALRLALGYALRTAAMSLLWGAVLYTGLRFVAPLFLAPALAALLCSALIAPVFRPFEEEQD